MSTEVGVFLPSKGVEMGTKVKCNKVFVKVRIVESKVSVMKCGGGGLCNEAK